MKSGVIITTILVALAVAGITGYVSTRGDNQNANTNSGGDRAEADGTIVKPDGTMIKPDGTSVSPDGTLLKPDGTVVKPDGTMIKPDGTMVGPDGKMIDEKIQTNSSTNGDTNTSVQGPSATYVDYSSAAFSTARATGGQTVLYFHAPWCPVCQRLEPSIRQNINDLPNGLTILKVDYDSQTELKKKYGVTYQHTFVQVDAQGNKLKLWSGSTDARAIADQVI